LEAELRETAALLDRDRAALADRLIEKGQSVDELVIACLDQRAEGSRSLTDRSGSDPVGSGNGQAQGSEAGHRRFDHEGSRRRRSTDSGSAIAGQAVGGRDAGAVASGGVATRSPRIV
jgi:hypothetical protein